LTSVRMQDNSIDDFYIIRLHQGSTRSPYFFTLVLDVLMKHIQDSVQICMLFYK